MAEFDDLKLKVEPPAASPRPSPERISLGKFELKYGPEQNGSLGRVELQRGVSQDFTKFGKLDLNYQSPYAPKLSIGSDIKLDLNAKSSPANPTTSATTAPASGPSVEQQRQTLETLRKQLSPKTWEEFTRTWGSKSIEEYKQALADYGAKVAEFTKSAGAKAAAGLELKITAGEMGFKTRLLAVAKRDGVENAVVARQLLATGMNVAAITSLTAALPIAERQKVSKGVASLDIDPKERQAILAALGSETVAVVSKPKKSKRHFGQHEITVTSTPVGNSKEHKG